MCDEKTSVYVYAFSDGPVGNLLLGLDDAPVETLVCHGVYAAFSRTPRGRVRPRRRLLAQHHHVLTALAQEQTVLPASFGLIADSEESLRALLCEQSDAIRAELDRVHGCVEVELELRWDVENVFEHLVSIDATLREQRDELTRLGELASHQLKVEIGRHVERLISSHREEHSATVLLEIEPACEDLRYGEPRDEAELLRASCLIYRDRVDTFKAKLECVAARFDESFAFNLKGPFAPHSFVNLNLSLACERADAA